MRIETATLMLNNEPIAALKAVNYAVDDAPAVPHVENRSYSIDCTVKQTHSQHRHLVRMLAATDVPRWRQKHRVGVHCARRRMPNGAATSWLKRHWYLNGRRLKDGFDRATSNAAVPELARDYDSERPAERALRFFGKRRSVRRRLDTITARDMRQFELGLTLAAEMQAEQRQANLAASYALAMRNFDLGAAS